jgi:hypothetical protein
MAGVGYSISISHRISPRSLRVTLSPSGALLSALFSSSGPYTLAPMWISECVAYSA